MGLVVPWLWTSSKLGKDCLEGCCKLKLVSTGHVDGTNESGPEDSLNYRYNADGTYRSNLDQFLFYKLTHVHGAGISSVIAAKLNGTIFLHSWLVISTHWVVCAEICYQVILYLLPDLGEMD